VLRCGRERESLTGPWTDVRLGLYDDPGPAVLDDADGVVTDHAVHERVAAEGFVEVDGDLDAGLPRRGDVQALGPDADDHVAGPAGCRPERMPTQDRPATDDRRRDQVHRGAAHEPGDEDVRRPVVDLLRAAQLLDLALVHHADPVRERHRLDLVVGDVDRGDAQPLVDPLELGADLAAQLGVEVRQRFVEQEGLGFTDQRPSHRDPLPLATRQLGGLAVEQLGDPEDVADLVDPAVDLRLGRLALAQSVGEVLAHAHVRVERVVLEHHRDVALARSLLGDDLAPHPDVTRGGLVQAGQQAERRALPAAGGPHEDHELAVGDEEVELLERDHTVGVALGHLAVLDFGHCSQPFSPVAATDRTK
jgi:hypothetical protein